MTDSLQLLVFHLDGQRYALPLGMVARIVRAAEITPLPSAPAIVLGVLDLEGHVLPVLNVRHRFRLPEREIRPEDQFLIARTVRRAVVLAIDEADGVLEVPAAGIVEPTEIVPGIGQIQGVVTLDDGLVLIHDLEKFLSLDEASVLDEAMEAEAAHGD